MKAKTRRLRQLDRVSHWLEISRPDLMTGAMNGNYATFALLVAVEQLMVYLKMLEEEKQ